MANDAPIREADILSQELICQESDSQWSQVTVGTKSEPTPPPQDEAVSTSGSGGIPEVPGRHKITTCKDVGFFAAASTTHEAILASSSHSHTSNASGSTEGDYAASGTQDESSSNLSPLKNAARVPDLFRSGTEGDSGTGQISTLEGRESGISLNESVLLSVDLTSADLGTICDVNDKNYYRQMVLRGLLNPDDTEPSESERIAVPEDEVAPNEDKDVGKEVQNIASDDVVSLFIEAGTCYELGRVCVKNDERTGKFKVVKLNNSSPDVFEDAAGSNAKNSGASLPAAETADTKETRVKETVVDGVVDTDLRVVSDRDSEERDEKSLSDMLLCSKKIFDSDSEINMDLQRYSSGDNTTPSVDENETVAGETGEMETRSLIYRSLSDTTARRLEKNARSLTYKSVLFLEALFRVGTENSLTASVRAGLCVTAVFIVLYAPSTIINLLTLYLQLLVCAIFVDIFLN